MVTSTMLDSINIRAMVAPALASGAKKIAYYLNGYYAVASIAAVDALFPPKTFGQVPIDVNGDRPDYALAGDVETGDMKPGQTGNWITWWNKVNPAYKAGQRPILYCNRDAIPDVRTGTGAYLLGRDYYLWVATGDGTVYDGAGLTGPYAKSGVIACQNTWSRLYDSSVVFNDGWKPGP